MAYLKVTSRGSIMDKNRTQRKPGEHMSKEDCIDCFGGAKEVDRLVDQGYLVRMYEQTDEDAPKPLPPQVQQAPPHPAVIEPEERKMETVAKGQVNSNVKMTGAGDSEIKETVVAKQIASGEGKEETQRLEAPERITTDNGPWNLDPATLKDKDIHELNVMVAERRDGIPPFETVQEAAAWLSQDFVIEEQNVATG